METADKEVERILTNEHPLHRKSWRRVRGWYRGAVEHAMLPA